MIPLPRIEADADRLAVFLPGRHRTASWALAGGGLGEAEAVVWCQVVNRDLGVDVDPTELMNTYMQRIGLADAIGLMTSAPVADHTRARHQVGQVAGLCVATTGLANALSAGDPVAADQGRFHAGTINTLVWVSAPLTDGALIEAVSIAAEARTAAVLEANVPSPRSQNPASGTGTDCIVVAAPTSANPRTYAGKHTEVGAVIGRVVRDAVSAGVAAWKRRRGHG